MSQDRKLVAAITRRLVWAGWVANAIGVAVVFIAVGFMLGVFLGEDRRNELGSENLPIVAGLGITMGLVFSWMLAKRRRRAFAWFVQGRDPTDEEHRAVLGLAWYTAALTAGGWGFGATVGFLTNVDYSLDAAIIIGTAFWLGGETTSALGYLFTESVLRPVTERALAFRLPERTRAPSVRLRMLMAWSLGTAAPLIGVTVVGLGGIAEPDVSTESVAVACVFLGAVALCLGWIATSIVARAIADPLNSLRDAVDRIGEGDLDVRVPIDDSSEVGLLQAGVNRMAEGLRERERIRDLFGRQVGEEVARAALAGGTRLGGEEREIGALFVDLTGSTSMALAMPPTHVVRLLNKFFRVVIEVVESEGGFVNKFEGDAALCVFGAPAPSDDPAGEAMCAARKLADRLDREVPEIGFGIGVSAGKAVAGNVGAEHRFEYTVIGDPVNEAARLSDLAKERQERVIASDAALDRASPDEREEWAIGERTVLRGRLDATGLALPRA
jgi:adenylate cyclase